MTEAASLADLAIAILALAGWMLVTVVTLIAVERWADGGRP